MTPYIHFWRGVLQFDPALTWLYKAAGHVLRPHGFVKTARTHPTLTWLFKAAGHAWSS
jgi:hypothetical protein